MSEDVEASQPAGKRRPNQQQDEDRPQEEMIPACGWRIVVFKSIKLIGHCLVMMRLRFLACVSGLEGRSATAASDRIRVPDAKTCPGQVVAVVDRGAFQVLQALRIHDDLH